MPLFFNKSFPKLIYILLLFSKTLFSYLKLKITKSKFQMVHLFLLKLNFHVVLFIEAHFPHHIK